MKAGLFRSRWHDPELKQMSELNREDPGRVGRRSRSGSARSSVVRLSAVTLDRLAVVAEVRQRSKVRQACFAEDICLPATVAVAGVAVFAFGGDKETMFGRQSEKRRAESRFERSVDVAVFRRRFLFRRSTMTSCTEMFRRRE